MSDENKEISAFAFQTGRLIEQLIIKTTNNLERQNQMLMAQILQFKIMLEEQVKDTNCNKEDILQSYLEYFPIKIVTKGTTEDGI
tara:strand:- start:8116 stop:8370 length:255 start_codon:yes stop_codon:yes gene_type:complete